METDIYKKGFRFKVSKNGIIGEIEGKSKKDIYNVCFYENGFLYLMADVYGDTITNNLQCGTYYEEGKK